MAFGQREYDRIEALLKTAQAAAAVERGRLSDLEVSRASAVTEMEWLGQSTSVQKPAQAQMQKGQMREGQMREGQMRESHGDLSDEARDANKPAPSGVFVGSADKRAVLTATIDTLSEEIASCSEALAACEWETTKLTALLRRFENRDSAQIQDAEPPAPPASNSASNSTPKIAGAGR